MAHVGYRGPIPTGRSDAIERRIGIARARQELTSSAKTYEQRSGIKSFALAPRPQRSEASAESTGRPPWCPRLPGRARATATSVRHAAHRGFEGQYRDDRGSLARRAPNVNRSTECLDAVTQAYES
jgi:hypothetical protein